MLYSKTKNIKLYGAKFVNLIKFTNIIFVPFINDYMLNRTNKVRTALKSLKSCPNVRLASRLKSR